AGITIPAQVTEVKARPGEYHVAISGTKSGEVTLTVSVGGITLDNKPRLTLLADSRTPQMTDLAISQSPVQAGDTVSYSLKVVDTNNNPLEGMTVSWQPAANLVYDNPRQTNLSSQTNTQGMAEISLNLLNVGTFVFKASLDGKQYQDMPTLTVTPAPIDVQKSTFVTSVAQTKIGGEATLTVTLLDKYDNPISGKKVNIELVNKLDGVKVKTV
ncbi:hypothetical protein FE392_19910, partial [Xenorhabdus sp. 12]